MARGKRDLKVGSVVLIREEGKSRLKWPLGMVTKVHEGKDGLIRAVDLKTGNGQLTRPVQKLHKLEISDIETESSIETCNSTHPKESADIPVENSSSEPNLSLPQIIKPVISRFGRKIKPRKILDL